MQGTVPRSSKFEDLAEPELMSILDLKPLQP